MADKRSNMQLDDRNSKPHWGKSLRDIIDRVISVRFYHPPGSENYKLLLLNRCHGSTHHKVKSHNNPEKIKCILCKLPKCIICFVTSSGKKCMGKTYFTFQQLGTSESTTRENTARSYIYIIQLCIIKLCITPVFSFDILHTRPDILHRSPLNALKILLYPSTNLHTKISPHTQIHKILPNTHHTHLHF